MGNASITHSLVWLALAACYDAPPEVQLVVTRTDVAQNLTYKVCSSDRASCKCPLRKSLFDSEVERQQRKLAIYVDGQAAITLGLQMQNELGVILNRCYLIELTDEMLVRPIDLSKPDPWCPMTSGCEVGEDCEFDKLNGENC